MIEDFQSSVDKIDLHDFMPGGHFIGTRAFSAGEGPAVGYFASTGVLHGDRNGDGVSDFTLKLLSHPALVATDFIFWTQACSGMERMLQSCRAGNLCPVLSIGGLPVHVY